MPGMKRFSTLLHKRAGGASTGNNAPARDEDAPESNAAKGVRLFCESGAPSNAGEEVLHLPVIVEAAESSPAAAASAAHQIRKFLSRDNYNRPHVQYNAIMLIRILADNPGPTFTRSIDEKFREAVKGLLRQSRDPSVQQIMRETLDGLEMEKGYDDNLAPLISMWKREKSHGQPVQKRNAPAQQPRYGGFPQGPAPGSYGGFQQGPAPGPYGYGNGGGAPLAPTNSRGNPNSQLPSPGELASRIEEARTSANLLVQLSQSTPPSEILSNDLIKEFAERCQSANTNLQGYMNSTNPVPDEDTFQTLIETCEKLSLASSRHQRAVLAARKEFGLGGGAASPSMESESPPPIMSNAAAATSAYPPRFNAPGPNYITKPRTEIPQQQPVELYAEPSSPSQYAASVAPRQNALPPPPPSLQTRLSERGEYDGPKPASLYPVQPTTAQGLLENPFSDNPFSDAQAVHAPPGGPPTWSKPQQTSSPQQASPPSNSYVRQTREPPMIMSSQQSYPQRQSPTSRSIPEEQRDAYNNEDDLYSSPATNRSPIQTTSPTQDWSASKAHWSNISSSISPPPPSSQPPPPPSQAAGAAATARARRGMQPTPSYTHRQEVATEELTSGGVDVGAAPTRRPPPLSSWGEESFVHGSGRVADDGPVR